MRNPIRPKNLKPRFWPVFLAAGLAIALSEPRLETLFAGLLFVLFGVGVRTWGAGHLVKNDLLACSGPYAYVRHPFYLGTLAVGTGFAVMLGGRSAVVCLALLLPWFFGFYFPRKERIESARLRALHGEPYERYREAVPALWPLRPAFDEARRVRWSWSKYDENNELGTLLACIAGSMGIVVWALARG